MSKIEDRRNRYMQDGVPTRIGGIAANLARISSVSAWPDSHAIAFDLFEESKFFIEWTAAEAESETTSVLIDLQLQLALWQLQLDSLWNDETSRAKIGRQAKEYSNDLLQRSGLLDKK